MNAGLWQTLLQLVTPIPHGFTHDALGPAVAVHLGRVDQCQARLDAGMDGRYFALAIPMPGR